MTWHATTQTGVAMPREWSHLMTSTGLQAVVLIRPATRLAVRCRCAPSDHPVAFTMARLISSYVAHWLAVRMAALDCTQKQHVCLYGQAIRL